MKSAGAYLLSTILAKIAASLWVKASNLHHCRASAHFFLQKAFIRAEARRGYFPPLFLQHQKGPP
jgi:hypothetical protein